MTPEMDDIIRIQAAFKALGPVLVKLEMNHAGLELLKDELTWRRTPRDPTFSQLTGIPIVVDPTCPRDIIRLIDSDGNTTEIRLPT